ncbi:hypothetical protein [Paraburkholderia tropica]|uniref:hypothetical protein n=1 Tax=Paraburkholderia tropica TaxID=92647 RepID=UPI002AB71DAB|nr:hypothetical protein [Paraburkholderia tropica]
MALNFVNYVAFTAAGKQVDREMREFRQSFGTESTRERTDIKSPYVNIVAKEKAKKSQTKR